MPRLGLCVPSLCSAKVVEDSLNSLLRQTFNALKVNMTFAYTIGDNNFVEDSNTKLTGGDIAALCVHFSFISPTLTFFHSSIMNQNWVQKSILAWLWHHFHLALDGDQTHNLIKRGTYFFVLLKTVTSFWTTPIVANVLSLSFYNYNISSTVWVLFSYLLIYWYLRQN